MDRPRLIHNRKPLPDDDPRHCLMLLPGYRAGRLSSYAWLYAVGFSNGAIKVGKTINPRPRLLTHWGSFKESVSWVHLGPRFAIGDEANRAERVALAECARIGQLVAGRETFKGLSKSDAIAAMRRAA